MLGYKRARCAVAQLVNPLDAVKHSVKVSGSLRKDGTPSKRSQQIIFVNESGFYALVLGSKLPTAVKFKNGVTSDVLPQIRKTDGYIPVQQGESDEETIRHAEEILHVQGEGEPAETQISKFAYFQRILQHEIAYFRIFHGNT